MTCNSFVIYNKTDHLHSRLQFYPCGTVPLRDIRIFAIIKTKKKNKKQDF
jgi:hypothetical protein